MHYLKKSLAVLIALLVPFSLVASANAADETAEATTTVTPRSGSFYKEARVASNLKIYVKVNTPTSSPKVNPLKNVKITFPAGMTFSPNNQKTPVCADSKLSQQSDLSDPKAVLAACPKSVVGTGTATIIIAKVNNNPNTVVSDPILVAFNGGRDAQGNPKLKIYGFSDYTNVGILMDGSLRGEVLDIAVPVLSNDSAVRHFDLDLPGGVLDRSDVPGIGIKTQGQDPNYVQAKCASSPLKTNATFELGERTYPGGTPTTPTTTVVAPETTQDCTGLAGKARLGGVKVAGPNAVKNGRVGAFRVTVKNTGTATARNVVVSSSRGGVGRAGNIAPGASKTVVVRTKIRGRKNSKVAVRFTAKSGAVKAAAVKRVTVR